MYIIENLYKLETEDLEDYFVRLFENKNTYQITCQDIADLLNRYVESPKCESAWRKEYAAFNRGRTYKEKCDEKGIATRILSISDLHIPFHKPIETFENYANKVDILQINGDVCDNQAISKFSKSYRISPMEEIIQARQYIIDLVRLLHPKKVVVNYGNHDIRFQDYFSKSVDTDLLELVPKTSLSLIFEDGVKQYHKRESSKTIYPPLSDVLKDVEINYVDEFYCQIGQTIFVHPIKYISGAMKTAEKAMEFFRNEGFAFTSLVMAHTHKIGEYVIGNTVLYEQGCCCETKKNNYNNGQLVNSQKEGFIYIAQDKDGKLLRDKTELICLN